MTESYGMKCPLVEGDKVRIVSSAMIDEIGVVSFVTEVLHGGVGSHRVTKRIVKFEETGYILKDTGHVIFGRHCLYKLPPDFESVTNLEAAQRIRKLLLTHTEE